MEANNFQQRLRQPEHWLRILFMILFFIIFNLAETLFLLIAIVQFVFTLTTGQANPRILQFSASLSYYTYQIARYLSYNTDQKPFPFTDWPQNST